MLIAAIFITPQKNGNNQKVIEWWMNNKMVNHIQWNTIHQIIYIYIYIKQALLLATTWMNLENFMPGKWSHVTKVTYYLIPFKWNVSRQVNPIKDKHRLVVSKGHREGNWD